MKNILIVTDTIDVNNGSGAKANIAIIENLMACGYDVHVIHQTIGKDVTVHFRHTRIKERKWSPLYIIGTFTRLLYQYTKININKWIEPLLGFSFEFFATTNAFARTIKKYGNEADLIITLSKGSSFRPHYAMLKCEAFHHKWIAYIHDPYPFHYYPRPYNEVQPGYRQKENFFHRMAQKARWFAFPGQLLMEWMGSYFPEMEKKGLVIPHQISVNTPDYFDTSQYWNNDDFNLLHAGNLLQQRTPFYLIEGFRLFLANNQEAQLNAKLHLVGPASIYKDELNRLAHSIPQLKLNINGVDYHIAYWLQQNAAVNIIIEAKSEISPFLPGKFPHCVKAGKPILLLSPYYSETKRLLGQAYPYWCENNDAKLIAEKIQQLYDDWKSSYKQLFYDRKNLLHYCSYENLHQILNNLDTQ